MTNELSEKRKKQKEHQCAYSLKSSAILGHSLDYSFSTAMGKNDKEPKLTTMELKVSVMSEMNHFGGNGCLKAETKCLLITLEIKCLYVQKIYDKDIFELVIF